jgi:hypothetical protein
MKKDLVLRYFGLAKHRCAHVHKKPDKASYKPKIEAPPFTV